MARLSFLQLAEALSLEVEAERVLPVRSNRARGETLNFRFGVHRTTFTRLYDHFYHTGERGTRDMGSIRGEKWEDLLQSSFEHLGATFYNTGHYDRMIDTAATIASAIGFMLVEDRGLRLLRSGALENIVAGDSRQLRVAQTSSRVEAGWLIALSCLLYHRKGSAEARAGLLAPEISMEALDEILWGFLPNFRETLHYEFYSKMLRGEELNVSKPGPKGGAERRKPKSPAPEPVTPSEAPPEVPVAAAPAVTESPQGSRPTSTAGWKTDPRSISSQLTKGGPGGGA